MRVFVDTSAILALRVATDAAHGAARPAFSRLQAEEAVLITTSYVLLETYALLGRRFGHDAVGALRSEFVPLLETVWVDEELHERGLDLLLAQADESLSLVDATSFVAARRQRLDRAFAYDPHFEQHGFDLV